MTRHDSDHIPEVIIQCALDSIACTGTYKAALSILRMTGPSFSAWRKRDENLAERVREAKAEYYMTSDYTRKRLARNYATKALRGESCEKMEETKEIIRDKNTGEEIGETRKVSRGRQGRDRRQQRRI